MLQLRIASELRAPRHPVIEPIGPSLPPSRLRLAAQQERRRRIRRPELEERVTLLCARLVGSQGPQLEERFWQICQAHRDSRRVVWRARDVRLSPDWFREPWLYVDLENALLSIQQMQTGLHQVAQLGFRNLAYTSGPNAMASPEHGPAFEALLRQADRLGLRITTGVDLNPLSPLRTPILPSRRGGIDSTEVYGAVLNLVAQELNRGVTGIRAHDVDRWVLGTETSRRADRQHALAGLMRILIQILAPRSVLIPELRSEQPGLSFALPSMQTGTQVVAAEGDIFLWRAVTRALHTSIRRKSAAPLRQAIADLPAGVPHAARWASLSRADLATSSAASEMKSGSGWAASRPALALALGILYALPATPVMHFSEEAMLAEDPTGEGPAAWARRLRRLNKVRRRSPQRVTMQEARDDRLQWVTDAFEFWANLGSETWALPRPGRLLVGLHTGRSAFHALHLEPGGYAFTVPVRPAHRGSAASRRPTSQGA